MALPSLHIPSAPSLSTYGAGVVVVVAYCAASFVFHRSAVGPELRAIPLVYFVGLHLTFAIAPAAGILGHIASGRPAALGWLGLGLGSRELSAALAAFTLGCVVSSISISQQMSGPGSFDRAAVLFANLLLASAAEALVFLAVAANLVILGLRQTWRSAPARGPEAVGALVAVALFALFHVSQAEPTRAPENLPLLASGWIAASAVFVLTRSLLASIVLIDIISLTCVMRAGAPFEGSMRQGLSQAAAAIGLFLVALWLTRQGTRSRQQGASR
jgi:hypothetical protein